MRELPTGTVTFLFTDIEGSTRLIDKLGADGYAEALAGHRRLVREACERHGGIEVDTQGDAIFIAFPTAPGALQAALEATEALASGPIRVRIGIHTGTPLLSDEGYVGSDVHRAARIAASGHGGQVLVSSATVSLVQSDALRDLGDHRLKDLSAPERIYQLGHDAFPPLKTLYGTNLPVPATPFVGRQRELVEITQLLRRPELHLVTLSGPGGIGKTRLALHAAGEVSNEYPDGVWWVPLAPVRDSTLVLEQARQALGAKAHLVEEVADKRLLLLLDNFEHLIDAASEVAELLSACPNLNMLVTSRELLRIPGEQAYPVPALEPEDGAELFVTRARASDLSFSRTHSVDELCSKLENLPLAVELAAARTAVLAPEQLLERLSQRLDLLKAGRGVDPRQQTLRATIQWSYGILRLDEQRLFARLSVFRGGCTLEAVEDVCEAEIDVLESLVDKSLVRARDGRFWMLETLREFAEEQLDAAGEAESAQRRHAEHFLVFAERVGHDTEDGGIAPWLGLLDADAANLRSALTYLSDAGETELVARIATPLWRYWAVRNVTEGSAWLAQATRTRDARVRAHALGGLGVLALRMGSDAEARATANEALRLNECVGDDRVAARSLEVLAAVASNVGDFDDAFSLYERAAEVMRASGDPAGLATTLGNLGYLSLQRGDFDNAIASTRESIALYAG